jgi:hypothetical protein
MHKFQCKDDFLNYFSQQRKIPLITLTFSLVQLYTPPSLMCNKDFLKAIISGEKELLSMSAIKMVNVPEFDELSVTNLWPHC